MVAFSKWVNDNRSADFLESLQIITDDVAGDVSVMNYHLGLAKLENMNHIIGGEFKPVHDCSSFHRGVGHMLPSDGFWGAEDAACKRLKITLDDNPHPYTHDALDDAKKIGWEIVKIHQAIEKQSV